MKYFFISLFLIVCTGARAAAKLAAFNAPPNYITADTDSVYRKQSVSVGMNYGSDVLFFGRTGPIRYPYVGSDAIYNFKTGAFLYASELGVIGYNPLVAEIDLGAGYLFDYSKKLNGAISYTRFLFNRDAAAVIKSASSNDINFKNTYDWKFAKSSIVFDYLFGDANDYFITLNTSKYIETDWGIFDDKDFLSFNPGISAILGTQNFVGKYGDTHPNDLDHDFIYPPGGDYRLLPRYNNGRFNALNYSIKLPIAYNRPHYTFEASWKYSIPVNVEGALKNRHEVFFNLTFYYVFY